jgi:hypothetical protein
MDSDTISWTPRKRKVNAQLRIHSVISLLGRYIVLPEGKMTLKEYRAKESLLAGSVVNKGNGSIHILLLLINSLKQELAVMDTEVKNNSLDQ